MEVIKIFGLPRTCTNLVELLLKRHITARVMGANYPCWKHGENLYPRPDIHNDLLGINVKQIRFVICLKNPLDWLWSLYTFQGHTKIHYDSFSKFLREFHLYEGCDGPIEAHNFLVRHWLTMPQAGTEDSIIKINQELMISPRGQQTFLERVASTFGTGSVSGFIPVVKAVQSNMTEGPVVYKQKKLRCSQADRQYILEHLDKDVTRMAGYDFWSEDGRDYQQLSRTYSKKPGKANV